MNIKSTQFGAARTCRVRYKSISPMRELPDFDDSWSVPRWISKPRSAIASTNNLLCTADKLGFMKNPLPEPAQTTISALGAVFAAANVTAELIDGDLRGALWDTGNSVVSLTTGARMLGLSKTGGTCLMAAGAALNTHLAVQQLKAGETGEGLLRCGNVAGISLSVAGDIVGGPTGAQLGTAGLALRGVIGLTGLIRDLTDSNGFLSRPDRFG